MKAIKTCCCDGCDRRIGLSEMICDSCHERLEAKRSEKSAKQRRVQSYKKIVAIPGSSASFPALAKSGHCIVGSCADKAEPEHSEYADEIGST